MVEALGKPPGRVAVASRSGVLVDECFGRAAGYRIYEAAPDGYRLAEIRPGPAPCRGQAHDLPSLAAAVESVSDCEMVLAGRIGPEAVRLLAGRGVTGLAVRIGIDDALERLSRRREPPYGCRADGPAIEKKDH
ncbi:MAG: dinitrogenase iron-molybdenum cofactor biosynthesis protein [Planctomycetota bacterium]|jgi:predicted Fe-Mo cluster-binding NifX family protein|nr:dinitrogenase iron-molybdenum cofactor biosynthesis protein [Planctomycetota bacterium]